MDRLDNTEYLSSRAMYPIDPRHLSFLHSCVAGVFSGCVNVEINARMHIGSLIANFRLVFTVTQLVQHMSHNILLHHPKMDMLIISNFVKPSLKSCRPYNRI
jgi:hypothetical protein